MIKKRINPANAPSAIGRSNRTAAEEGPWNRPDRPRSEKIHSSKGRQNDHSGLHRHPGCTAFIQHQLLHHGPHIHPPTTQKRS